MSDSPREAGENRELSPLSRVPMESESMMNSPKHSSPKSPLRESIRSPLRESISSLSGTNMEQMDRVLEMMGNSPVLGAFDGLDEWDMSNGKKKNEDSDLGVSLKSVLALAEEEEDEEEFKKRVDRMAKSGSSISLNSFANSSDEVKRLDLSEQHISQQRIHKLDLSDEIKKLNLGDSYSASNKRADISSFTPTPVKFALDPLPASFSPISSVNLGDGTPSRSAKLNLSTSLSKTPLNMTPVKSPVLEVKGSDETLYLTPVRPFSFGKEALNGSDNLDKSLQETGEKPPAESNSFKSTLSRELDSIPIFRQSTKDFHNESEVHDDPLKLLETIKEKNAKTAETEKDVRGEEDQGGDEENRVEENRMEQNELGENPIEISKEVNEKDSPLLKEDSIPLKTNISDTTSFSNFKFSSLRFPSPIRTFSPSEKNLESWKLTVSASKPGSKTDSHFNSTEAGDLPSAFSKGSTAQESIESKEIGEGNELGTVEEVRFSKEASGVEDITAAVKTKALAIDSTPLPKPRPNFIFTPIRGIRLDSPKITPMNITPLIKPSKFRAESFHIPSSPSFGPSITPPKALRDWEFETISDFNSSLNLTPGDIKRKNSKENADDEKKEEQTKELNSHTLMSDVKEKKELSRAMSIGKSSDEEQSALNRSLASLPAETHLLDSIQKIKNDDDKLHALLTPKRGMSFTEESKELLKEVKENTVGSKENVMNSAENQIEKLDKETKEKESSESRQRKLKEHWDYKLDSNKRQLAGLESSEDASVVFRKQASNLRKQIVPANLRGPVKDLIPRNSLSSGYADILNRVESPKLDFSISGFLSKSPRTPKRKVHAGFRGDISAENPFHISPIRTPVGVTPVHTPPRYLENAQNFAKMLTMDLTPGRHRSDPLSAAPRVPVFPKFSPSVPRFGDSEHSRSEGLAITPNLRHSSMPPGAAPPEAPTVVAAKAFPKKRTPGGSYSFGKREKELNGEKESRSIEKSKKSQLDQTNDRAKVLESETKSISNNKKRKSLRKRKIYTRKERRRTDNI